LAVQYLGEHAKDFSARYGNISLASVGAIQRSLVALETEGADRLFGEPALNLDDLLQTDAQGRGGVNLLAANRLIGTPKVYWMNKGNRRSCNGPSSRRPGARSDRSRRTNAMR
jgi:DNA helicase HerA-like ATPase